MHCLCGRNTDKSLGMGTALCGRDQQTFYKGSDSKYFGLCGPLGLRGNHSVLEGLSATVAVRKQPHTTQISMAYLETNNEHVCGLIKLDRC